MALVSIVIPVYYNAGSLAALAGRLAEAAEGMRRHQFEFIYVDDGSGDDSFQVLRRLAEQDRRVRVIKLARNFGSNTAILAGLTHARGDCAGFIAADLQDPPEKLAEMIEGWEAGEKVVLAVRNDRQGDPFFTRLFANLFNWLFKKLVYRDFSPQGVGFFLVDRQVVNFLVECREKNAHLIGLILWSGFPFSTVGYERVERSHGKSRWTFGKKFKYFIDAFAAFSYLPLRLATVLGLALAGLGGLYALLLVILRLLNRVPVQGWTAMIVVITILSGTQLIILGVVGEYLWRTFDAARQRPLFVIEETIDPKTGLAQ
jgi:dolichol-phosphate mannosyltransferase